MMTNSFPCEVVMVLKSFSTTLYP